MLVTTDTVTQWVPSSAQHFIGQIIYLQTSDSRRKARVVGFKPGAVLLIFTP